MIGNEGIDIISVIQQLSMAKSLEKVAEIVRHAARVLTGADGATFVLRDGDLCYYMDEEAISPLWKGLRFPMSTCISGWSMLNKETVFIQDIYTDSRIPHEAYRPTFVRSLVMVPVRKHQPIAAIGNYWATEHEATEEEIQILEALANSTSIAVENIQLVLDLQKANSSLATSLKARDEFLSIASHELNTPLCALKLQLQMTQKRFKSNFPSLTPEALEKTFEMSLKQINGLSYIVSGLLDLSKIQLDRMYLSPSSFCLSDLIIEIVDIFRPQLGHAQCRVHTDIEENVMGIWDHERIGQVIYNLLSNVVKYAPGTPVHIGLRKLDNESVFLTIHDSGPGIPEDFKQRIFQLFERAKSVHNISGMGLGLYIVKKLVESHHGDIQVESQEGHGTRFSITLPLRSV